MLKLRLVAVIFCLWLCLLAAGHGVVSAEFFAADSHEPETALLGDTQNWLQRANLWRLVARGEDLLARVKIEVVKSNLIEAWVCGAQKVCVSTRLLDVFSAEEQQAVVAHEVGHMLIPRSYDAHPQLWEAQCDLFAVALLRDMELVKQMLGTLGDDCNNCSDAEHPPPAARAILLDRLAALALTKVQQLDHLRGRNFAVQFKPDELKRLSLARTSAPQTARQLEELKALNFSVNFTSTLLQQRQAGKD